jgi:hypothetical protein
MHPVAKHSFSTPGVEVVAGLFASGTTYYTSFLNWVYAHTEPGAPVAYHEHIYPYDRKTWNEDIGAIPRLVPRPGQKFEVSGFALPYEVDTLLVRNPQLWIPSIQRLLPIFQQFTQGHLGFTPRDNFGLSLAWYRWNQQAIERFDPLLLTIESVPVIEGLKDNSHGPAKEPVGIEDFAPEALSMMKEFGYASG